MKRGPDDLTVRRIAQRIDQTRRLERHRGFERYDRDPAARERRLEPLFHRTVDTEAAGVHEERDLPESDGGDAQLAPGARPLDAPDGSNVPRMQP